MPITSTSASTTTTSRHNESQRDLPEDGRFNYPAGDGRQVVATASGSPAVSARAPSAQPAR